MNFVCIQYSDKMLTLSSMESLIVPCNRPGISILTSLRNTGTSGTRTV